MIRVLSETSHSNATVDAGHEPHLNDTTYLGFFVVTVLAIGVVTSVIKRHNAWVKLPFTLLVFLAGGALGGLNHALVNQGLNLGLLSDSIEHWRELDPEILLFMFLPPLLFTSAFSVEYHIFRRLATQAVLLATVAVMINVLLIALVSMGFFGYDWGWQEGLLFGGLFAATDPVAVVSLLKELGAPETLSVLIEGESLLNDGVGFVLFIVFFENLSGRQQYDATSVAVKVVVSSTSGGLIGVVMGILSLMALQTVWEDGTLAVVITVITVWLTFFVCEMLQVSGVIGVVCLGLVYAAMSDGYIQVDVLADLKRFWQRIEYMANTLVFVYSGLVVLETLSQARGGYAVSSGDIINLFVLFIMINVVRAISVAVLYKPLKMLGGYGMSWDRVAVVSYAGLRGAVGLIGALLVFDEDDCEDTLPGEVCIPFDTKSRMMFLMSGIVLMTLAINGTTTKFLVGYLNLNKQGDAARHFFEKATFHLHDHIDYVVESLKRHPHYKNANWEVVWSHVPVLSEDVLAERKRLGILCRNSFAERQEIEKITKQRFVQVNYESGGDSGGSKHSVKTRKKSLAASAMHAVTASVTSWFATHGKTDSIHSLIGLPDVEIGSSSSASARTSGGVTNQEPKSRNNGQMSFETEVDLQGDEEGSVDSGSDDTSDHEHRLAEARHRFLNLVKASYRHQFQEGANSSWPSMQVLMEAASRCQDHTDRPIQEWDDSIAKYVALPSWALPGSCVGTLGKFYFNLQRHVARSYDVAATFVRAHKSVISQFRHFSRESTADTVNTILHENHVMILKAQAFTESIELEYPEIAQAVKTNVAVHRLLKEMETYSHKMFERAEIDEKDLQTIENALENRRHHLKTLRKHRVATRDQIVRECPFFLDVNREIVDVLLGHATNLTYEPNSVVFNQKDKCNSLMLITKGRVMVEYENGVTLEKSLGDVLGIVEFVAEKAYCSTGMSRTTVEVVCLPMDVATRAMNMSDQFADNVFREAGLLILESLYPQFQYASFNLLKSVLPHVRLLRGTNTIGAVLDGQGPISSHPSANARASMGFHAHRSSSVTNNFPIFFHGGLLIVLKGSVTTQDTNENVPRFTGYRPMAPVLLSADAVVMHVNADAITTISEFTSFDQDDHLSMAMSHTQSTVTTGKGRRRTQHKKSGHLRHRRQLSRISMGSADSTQSNVISFNSQNSSDEDMDEDDLIM